jgi:hypothetical protein
VSGHAGAGPGTEAAAALDVVAATAERLLQRPLPFASGAQRHHVATRTVPDADWLEVDGADVAAQLAHKRLLFRTRRPEVLVELDGSRDACIELRDLVLEHLERWAPRLLPGPRPVEAHPLEEAGLLVPEDFCVHLPDPVTGMPVLVAGCVCFPNRWRLPDKIGRPVTEIHQPVPAYDAQLAGPVDRLMAKLQAGRVLARSNWGLADGSVLFAPDPRPAWSQAPRQVGARLWLRIERQTLRRLPRTGAVVFTIRTVQAPLETFRGDAEATALLTAALQELPDAVADYKIGGHAVRTAVLRWLGAPE